ncbi:DUF6676 family protein [Rhodococcus sp. NPDC058505]|uniref:Rv1476 family membrane protein n=1 Tax=unclassified Rhodococcus (in: high G+C Gram-positive bacteria) TaxID=192944 RepID=UPI00365FC99E
MPAAHTVAFLPAPADIPPGVDIDTIRADLSDDGVSAPSADVAELQDVVARAGEHDLTLRIVVLDRNPGRDEQLRDIATEIGTEDGGTVLVLSPNWVGTYSDSLARVTIEDAQDHAYTGKAVDSANQFLDEVIRPDAPYGLITIGLVLVVGGGAAATWLLRTRRLDAERRSR